MGLIDKIESIREKPEYIRLRYVWFFVASCMIFILAIWFFSLKSELSAIGAKNSSQNQLPSEIKKTSEEILNQMEKQRDEMQNAQKNITDALSDELDAQ